MQYPFLSLPCKQWVLHFTLSCVVLSNGLCNGHCSYRRNKYKTLLLLFFKLWGACIQGGHKDFFFLREILMCLFPLSALFLPVNSVSQGTISAGWKDNFSLSCSALLHTVLAVTSLLCFAYRCADSLEIVLKASSYTRRSAFLCFKALCTLILLMMTDAPFQAGLASTLQLLIMKEDLVQEFTKLTLISSG